MPKNFFKTFLVAVSIFLFSAGIIIPISVEALPIDGCCVNSTDPNNECIVPDKDASNCHALGDNYNFYTPEKCSNLQNCGSVSAPDVGCCIDDADTYNKCVVSKIKNKIIKNKADCDSISDNGNFIFLSSNTLPEECANNPECSPETIEADSGTTPSAGATPDNGTTPSSSLSGIYPSQCSVTDPNSGKESDCVHTNDTKILNNQCKKYYGDSSPYCSRMKDYLDKMASDCSAESPTGIDCSKIASGGIYGKEASAFAKYLASNSNSNNLNNGGSDSLGLDAISNKFGLPDPKGGIHQILEKLLIWMLELIGLIALIAFVISGTQYFLAFGDETRTEKAKKAMTYAIIGVVVALAGFVVVKAVDMALRATGQIF